MRLLGAITDYFRTTCHFLKREEEEFWI